MSDELPTVSIDGESYWPALLLHRPGSHGLEMAEFNEAALSALLAALSPEQRERVLGDTGPLVGALSDKLNEYIDKTKEAEAELESERARRERAER